MNKKDITEQVKSLKQLASAITYSDNSPAPPPNMLERNNSVSTLRRICDFPDKSRHLQPATMFMNCSHTEGAPFW